MSQSLLTYIYYLGDNSLILGHRLSELCGHGPNLETDMALTNISLDLFGQVRNYFQYAATLYPEQTNEDKIAFLRYPHEYRNVLLVEQPNMDFAHVITRQYLFDQFHLLLLEQLCNSKDATIAAVAAKSIKEVRYHLRFSSSWVIRLGDGTAQSHQKMSDALNHLWPYSGEFFLPSEYELDLQKKGIIPDVTTLQDAYVQSIQETFSMATLTIPSIDPHQQGGKQGVHSEHFGYILSELQYMQRMYPEMNW